ncbi:MAG: sulfate adenylyltransferase subunit 1 [Chitinophagaceae bacterium]
MDLLKFISAGSVDDGKSTLIGRLLYDSKSILVDQLEQLEKQSVNGKSDGIDLALLTDGLRAEREQGITIDVAYRYFTTSKRKFIIADAPGHVQYTRNMFTGASNSDLVIILIDARQGVVEQTRRHSIIASLLRMKHVVVAINKMDLVDFSEKRFNDIVSDYTLIAAKLGLQDVAYFPLSAIDGDNIVERSERITWYKGPSLLSYLEEINIDHDIDLSHPRFQVQFVLRPQSEKLHDYRGYAGRVQSGIYRKGDSVTILPSGLTSRISQLEVNGKSTEEIFSGQSAVILLEDDIDISRGDTIALTSNLPEVVSEFDAVICWMDEKPLVNGNKYILQHRSKLVRAVIRDIKYKLDVNSLAHLEVNDDIKLNDVVRVTIKTASPLAVDSFDANAANGAAILIDETSNSTVAAVLIQKQSI